MEYGSARDMPKFQEMERNLSFLRVAGFLSKDVRRQVRDVRHELTRIVEAVDGFYSLLGERNWVFHEHMNVSDMLDLARSHSGDPAAGEQALIDWYSMDDRLRDLSRRVTSHPDLRPRRTLVDLAVEDQKAGRFYSVVQTLLSVMDGFVNDVDKAKRRGLHAREPGDMQAWDSVVGHHLGLTSAHRSFVRSFKARSDEPVHDLFRNGIVHGMLTNYNNPIVATKAWNRLFAVADWARSLEAQQREAEKPPEPTFREVVAKLSANAGTKAALADFKPVTLSPGDQDFEQHPAHSACRAFLEAWSKGNYGHMARFPSISWRKVTPRDLRNDYQGHPLDGYDVLRLDHEAAAICLITTHLSIQGRQHKPQLRWVREGDEGRPSAPNEPGEWRLMWWGLPHMLQDGS